MQIAEEAYRKSRYAGPAPVSLAEYRQAVKAQAFKPELTQESLAERLSDLVLTEDTISNLGAALMTGGAIFLYGPTGNGKTSIAERLRRIYHDLVYVPYAIEVSGEVLGIFDPIVHQPVEAQPKDIDPRWVLCHRPFLTVGGEMRADMLEPHVDQHRHIVRAPVQLRANNGILVIDDFGRQKIQPRELLNRWIVPLDRRVDYISWFGTTIEVPFELIVVFATNLDLASLAEEAFVRRIKNKIKVDRISDETFLEIMRRQCARARGSNTIRRWADMPSAGASSTPRKGCGPVIPATCWISSAASPPSSSTPRGSIKPTWIGPSASTSCSRLARSERRRSGGTSLRDGSEAVNGLKPGSSTSQKGGIRR